MRTEDEAGVVAAEPEPVRDRELDLLLPRLPRDVVEIAHGIGRLEVEGRRQDAPLEREHGEDRLHRTGGAECMPGRALRRGHRYAVGMLLAERRHATPAQVALAWVLAQKPWIVPIPGTTKLHRLDENIAAAQLELTDDDLREIEDALPQAVGARYAEAQQRMIDR